MRLGTLYEPSYRSFAHSLFLPLLGTIIGQVGRSQSGRVGGSVRCPGRNRTCDTRFRKTLAPLPVASQFDGDESSSREARRRDQVSSQTLRRGLEVVCCYRTTQAGTPYQRRDSSDHTVEGIAEPQSPKSPRPNGYEKGRRYQERPRPPHVGSVWTAPCH